MSIFLLLTRFYRMTTLFTILLINQWAVLRLYFTGEWSTWRHSFMITLTGRYYEALSTWVPLLVTFTRLTLPRETVSSRDKPVVTNQSGSTSVDAILLKACLPGPFSFLRILASYYFDARGSNCTSSTACSKESSSVLLIMLICVSCWSK